MKRREFISLLVAAAGAWPVAIRAQPKMYRVALLTLDSGEDASQLSDPLRDLGYVEGKNLNFVHRSADGDPGRLSSQLGPWNPGSAAAITLASGLHGRAGNGTIGAKYAAMSRQRLQALTAFLAVVEKLARVGWHGLRRWVTTVRTGEHGFD